MFDSTNVITPSRFVFSKGSVVLKESCEDPECVPIPDFTNIGDKNIMLHLLRKQYHLSPEKIVLFDDSDTNISSAKDYGYKAVHTPDGFNFQHLE